MSSTLPSLSAQLERSAFPEPRYINYTVRGMKMEYEQRVFVLRLPFQRKPVWKEATKTAYIRALATNGVTDPISLSKRGRYFRCINGGNRIRAIIGFTRNEFPLVIGDHSYWYSEVPEPLTSGRKSLFNHVMAEEDRNNFDVLTISAVYRDNLTDAQEIDLYNATNVNMVPHGPGHLLLSHICDIRNEMGTKFIDDFPVVKNKIGVPIAPTDHDAFGTRLAMLLDVDIDINNSEDKKEDVLLALANTWNLLQNGKCYDTESYFQGPCDREKFAQHERKLCSIFEGLVIPEDVRQEWKSETSRKHGLSEIWNPGYLLGAMAWSIAMGKDDAVSVWRQFLTNYRVGLMHEIYEHDVKPVLASFTVYNTNRYKKTWEAVVARQSTASGTA